MPPLACFNVRMFDSCWMAHDRLRPDTDQLTVACSSGIAIRHASWREPTEDETATAVAELPPSDNGLSRQSES
jgi:hypothetical protein